MFILRNIIVLLGGVLLSFFVSAQDISDGRYKIINANSDKCLRTLDGSEANAAEIVQFTCSENDFELWDVIEISPHVYNLVQASSGKYADIEGGYTNAGAGNIIWPAHGGLNQQWNITELGNGFFIILST